MDQKTLDEIRAQCEAMTPVFIASARQIVPELLDEIERLREENRWIPVGERLPTADKMVLCWTKDGVVVTVYWWDGWHTGRLPETVTHWRPLPKGPEKEENHA